MNKTFTLMVGLLAVIMFLGGVSAALTVSVPNLSQTSGSFNITITNDGNQTEAVNLSTIPNINDGNGNLVTFAPTPSSLNIENGTSGKILVNYVVGSNFNFDFTKTYSTSFNVTGNVSTSVVSTNINMENTYCGNTENKGNIAISNIDVKTLSGFGDDQTWYLLNNMQFKIDVQNNGNYDLRNVKVQWDLYSGSTRLDHGTSDSFSLRSGNDNTVTVNTILDRMQDLGDVKLYVKAVGQINDNNAGNYNGNQTCNYQTQDAYIDTSTDFVIPDDISVNGILMNNSNDMIYNQNVSCESSVTIAGNLWDISGYDQSNPYLVISSPLLNVSKIFTFSNINSYDSSSFTYTFKIPSEITQKLYQVAFRVYNDNNKIYQDSNGHDAIKNVYLNVYGNCVFYAPSVSAALNGDARAGREMVVNFTVTNNQDKQMTYDLNLENYNSWSTLESVSPEFLVIPAHSTQTAQIKLMLNKDSEGEHTFSVVTSTDNRKLWTQPVSVTVAKKGFKLSDYLSKETLQTTGIVLLDLIILIAIIIVVSKILKRKK